MSFALGMDVPAPPAAPVLRLSTVRLQYETLELTGLLLDLWALMRRLDLDLAQVFAIGHRALRKQRGVLEVLGEVLHEDEEGKP